MEILQYIILDKFYEKPLKALSNKAFAKWFLENRLGCKLHILLKAKIVPITKQFEECLF